MGTENRESIDRFLGAFTPPKGHPWLLLSFAQSSDGKIAAAQGQRTGISGAASMEMTHRLRALHDAILVGIGTVLTDDPQLNGTQLSHTYGTVRLGSEAAKHPRPVVLDDELRTPLTSRLLQNASNGQGRAPLLFSAFPQHAADVSEWHRRLERLTHAGAEIVQVEADASGKLTWPAIRAKLQELHLFSVMVEGGAAVINSLLTANAEHPGTIQTAILTLSPEPIGPNGVAYSPALPLSGGEASGLRYSGEIMLAPDRVVGLRS